MKWRPGGETDDSGLCKGTEGDRIPLIERLEPEVKGHATVSTARGPGKCGD